MNSPIVVGGTGGSGTRLVAELLQHAGIFMGKEDGLNYAMDSIPMNRLDMSYLRPQGGDLRDEVISRAAEHHRGYAGSLRWGWKHTQSYLTLPMLHRFFPDMTFVHVIRDGRDLAYAPIIALPVFGVAAGVNPGPETLIALWEVLNVLCADYGENFIQAYYRVRYEDLCNHRAQAIGTMYEFLGLEANVERACELVRPGSLGRWRGKGGIEKVEVIGEYALKRFGYL